MLARVWDMATIEPAHEALLRRGATALCRFVPSTGTKGAPPAKGKGKKSSELKPAKVGKPKSPDDGLVEAVRRPNRVYDQTIHVLKSAVIWSATAWSSAPCINKCRPKQNIGSQKTAGGSENRSRNCALGRWKTKPS
jgi:hypothetical protein